MKDQESQPDAAKKLRLKSCPRCATGDILSDRDVYGEYIQCLACGYTHDLPALQDEDTGSEAITRQRPTSSRSKRGAYRRGSRCVGKRFPPS